MGAEEGNYLYPADEANFRGGANPAYYFTPEFFFT
jgi:hypothetical protein